MVKRTLFVSALLMVVALSATLITPSRDASSSTGACGSEPSALVKGVRSDARRGRALLTVTKGRVVAPEVAGGTCVFSAPGVLRHVAVEPGVGTVYVEDVEGDDRLVVVDDDGTEVLAQEGEVTQPTWSGSGRLAWAVDFRTLEISGASTDTTRTVRRPAGTSAVFSPLFAEPGEITSVVQETAASPAAAEDDFLNNLWTYDLSSGRWDQLTHFKATAVRWSIIRTPVATGDGEVLFVRVTGDVTATVRPAFELWKIEGRRVSKLADLPGEMYLAGFDGGKLLWNAYTDACGGDWGLFRAEGNALEEIGCGAVMTDPVVEPDPDVAANEHAEDAVAAAVAEGESSEDQVGVLVGDFSSRGKAQALAARTHVGVKAQVVNHEDEPLAVRPGAWAVVYPVAPGEPADPTLEAVHRELPAYRDQSWIVPLTN